MITLSRFAVGASVLHLLFLLYVMHRMSGGGFLTELAGWIFAGWAVSPIIFVTWRLSHAPIWIAALLPMILIGTYEAYVMGFVSTSSTTALGFVFLPAYEWVFIAVFALIAWLMRR